MTLKEWSENEDVPIQSTESILDNLDNERRKFTRANRDRMESLCNHLLRLGVYPPGKREIKVYSRGLDRTIYFQCPDCDGKIPHGECLSRDLSEGVG